MRRLFLTLMVAGLLGGALFGLSGCYATQASVGVAVEAGPPAPVSYYGYGGYYGSGSVFIDGHWVWTATGWQWYPGYWVAARPGYVYIQGYWDFWGGGWVYRPGIWARHQSGLVWVGGRWIRYQPGYHHYDYRRGTWVRSSPGRPVRDHRTYNARPPVRDHRSRPPSQRSAPRTEPSQRR